MKRIHVTVAAVAAALLALLVGCGDGSSLKALQDDPVANERWEHTTLADEAGQSEGKAMGKPIAAEVTRTFTIDDGTDPADMVAQVKAFAEDHGWQAQESPEGSFSATKDVEGHPSTLTVTMQSDGLLLVLLRTA